MEGYKSPAFRLSHCGEALTVTGSSLRGTKSSIGLEETDSVREESKSHTMFILLTDL